MEVLGKRLSIIFRRGNINMRDKIRIVFPIVVHTMIKNKTLRNIAKKFPIIEKFLFRLPEKFVKKIFVEDYTVTERIIDNGFVFMSLHDLPYESKILDVGCCENTISLQLACLGFKVYGIDINEYPFYHPKLTFVKGSICKTNFEDNFFDAVIAVSTLEHIGLGWYGDSKEDSDIKAVNEIKRILKPRGKFILTVPYGVKQTTKVFRVYDKQDIKKLTEGFEIIDVRYSKNFEDKYWSVSTEEEVSKCGINKRGRNEGNICLLLIKK